MKLYEGIMEAPDLEKPSEDFIKEQ